MNGLKRNATHAGSWYSSNSSELDRQLTDWLSAVGQQPECSARVIISPHAGYSYCGNTAAYAFKQIIPDEVNIIFVLGPSHVAYLSSCALTACSHYRTPLGDLPIDTRVNAELKQTGAFEQMDHRDENAEHSIEMQLPYIAKIMEKRVGSYTIVPVLVGGLTTHSRLAYGKIFAKYLADPRIAFVISSDFCHWGARFHFTSCNENSDMPIHEQIAKLDKEGMDAISSLDPNVFSDYLKKTQNTICGRNPISIIMQAAEYYRQSNNHSQKFVFLKYSQSNQCHTLSDSSVSYAAGALFINSTR